MNATARAALTWVAVVAALVGLLTVLGGDPGHTPGVMTDTLGPDRDEPAAAYLERARATLDGHGDGDPAAADDAPRWALVSPAAPWAPREASEAVAPAPRVGQVLAWAPEAAAEFPPVALAVPEPAASGPVDTGAGDRERTAVFATALDRARDSAGGRGGPRVLVGLVVRADPATLRALAARPGVRAVEALPPDAVAGRFPVRALLPDGAPAR